jgi:hypothetical protein
VDQERLVRDLLISAFALKVITIRDTASIQH